MNKTEVKEKWISALRSGKYTQGVKLLHHKGENSFCCLGVLCDVLECKKINIGLSPGTYYKYKDSGHYTTLPHILSSELEMTVAFENSLVKMNDNGYSFSEIADYIEETWKTE